VIKSFIQPAPGKNISDTSNYLTKFRNRKFKIPTPLRQPLNIDFNKATVIRPTLLGGGGGGGARKRVNYSSVKVQKAKFLNFKCIVV
jgi:hypothetical protein